MPRITILLPVYNCPRYVGAAIESILAQTHADFEFLIIDDGSTDDTPSVLERYADPRIRHVRQANRGLAGTLNVGIEMARGELIARQDQDDLSHPERLARQLAYFQANPSCVLLGTAAEILEGETSSGRFHRHPTDSTQLRYELLFNNPFVHSSVMFPRAVVRAEGGYSTDPARQPPEDYELWSRLARRGPVANLPDPLLIYREIPGSMSRVGPSPFRERLVRICAENISLAAGARTNDPAALQIAALIHGAPELAGSKLDFVAMKKVLLAAVETIDPDSESLQRAVKEKIAVLQGIGLTNRAGLGRFLGKKGPLREFAKACYRLASALRKH